MYTENVKVADLAVGDVVWIESTLRVLIDKPLTFTESRLGTRVSTFGYVLNPEALDAISDPYGTARRKLTRTGGNRWEIAGRVESHRLKIEREVK